VPLIVHRHEVLYYPEPHVLPQRDVLDLQRNPITSSPLYPASSWPSALRREALSLLWVALLWFAHIGFIQMVDYRLKDSLLGSSHLHHI
jgi:hypothetical protein